MKKCKILLGIASGLMVMVLVFTGCTKTGSSSTTTTTTKPATTQATSTTVKPPTTTLTATSAAPPTTSAPATKTLKPLPSIITIASTAASTVVGATAIAEADLLGKLLGIKVTFDAYGTQVEIAMALKLKRADMWATSTSTLLDPVMGTGDYSRPEWGPQPLRTITVGADLSSGLATSKKTGIRVMADVKGRTVAFYPGQSTRNDTEEAILKAHGLTWNDVKKVNFDSAFLGAK